MCSAVPLRADNALEAGDTMENNKSRYFLRNLPSECRTTPPLPMFYVFTPIVLGSEFWSAPGKCWKCSWYFFRRGARLVNVLWCLLKRTARASTCKQVGNCSPANAVYLNNYVLHNLQLYSFFFSFPQFFFKDYRAFPAWMCGAIKLRFISTFVL